MTQVDPFANTHYDPKTGKPIAHPLDSLDEVWHWKKGGDFFCVATVPLSKQCRKMEKRPRTLVCHDMKGGYIEDRFVEGDSSSDCYRIYHWQFIDIFVYFSHHFVTIPPPCWTNAAHTHGVPVLGTLITENVDGYTKWSKILKDRSPLETLVKQLVDIAEYYGFDGWFINIENSIQKDQIKNLEEFVKDLTAEMHDRIPNSLVIWYDAVTVDGFVAYQNELNDKNKVFFEACDGIFLNYGWSTYSLENSFATAGPDRQDDVYVGVNVFRRGEYTGYNCYLAFEKIRKYKLSAALFAPGWVMEKQGTQHFTAHEDKFWNLLAPYCTVHTAVMKTPFVTSMGRGYGKTGSIDGKTVLSKPWTNLSAQQYQPTFNNKFNLHGEGLIISSVGYIVDEAYNGGGCQLITGHVNSSQERSWGELRLFKTDFPKTGPLLISFTYKLCPKVSVDVALQLKLHHDTMPSYLILCPPSLDDQASGNSEESDDNKKRIRRYGVPKSRTLRSSVFISPIGQEHCQLLEPLTGTFHDSVQQALGLKEGRDDGSNWCTSHYVIADEQSMGVKVQEVGVVCSVSPGATTTGAFKLYLGEIKIIDPQVLKQPIPLARNIRCLDTEWKPTEEGYQLNLILMWDCPIKDGLVDEPAYYNIFKVADGSHVFLGRAFVEAYKICPMRLSRTCSSVEFVVQVVTRSGLKRPPRESSHFEVKR